MATTKQTLLLLQHPSHHHPLELRDMSNEIRIQRCRLCHRKISSAEAFTCQEGCEINYYHRACVKAPSQIDRHPLHPKHPLPLLHYQRAFRCNACGEHFYAGGSSFRCNECNFNLDVCCALSTLSDEGGSRGGKTSEQITLPLHSHTLTSFSTRHEFVEDRDCYVCRGIVEGDGYTCLRLWCKFVIHKRCIQDLYYADGTKAPRVYHGHPLEIFVGEDTGSNKCARCGSDKSGEFIGCASCQVFYHRHCFLVPEILQYPSHNQDHTLVLFPEIDTPRQCQSCASSLKNEIYYRCTSCEFFVHVGCAIQVLAYCEVGMSAKIELSWHKHPLLLCHRTKSTWNGCFYCGDESIGPTYACKEKDCRLLLHKRCTEIESTITHPHHPNHSLTLCESDDDHYLPSCEACGGTTDDLRFSCKHCLVNLHVKCAAQFPTHKHYLHEHKLVCFKKSLYLECNRCGRITDSPLFRCVPCNFNLHEECMELPRVVKHNTHVHPLTLRDFYMEDDSGEYYCDLCEKRRDGNLGVYVCEECKVTWAFQIECILPELRNVYAKKSQPSVVKRMDEQITRKNEEVHTIEENLEEAMQELNELLKRHDELVYQEEQNFLTTTEECEQENSV